MTARHKRSLWIKEHRDTSVWPYVLMENVEPETFSMWMMRGDGCVRLIILGLLLAILVIGALIIDNILILIGLVVR